MGSGKTRNNGNGNRNGNGNGKRSARVSVYERCKKNLPVEPSDGDCITNELKYHIITYFVAHCHNNKMHDVISTVKYSRLVF